MNSTNYLRNDVGSAKGKLNQLHQQQQLQQPLTTNQRVVVWVQGHLGKTVGRGECWDLGEQALKQAGAQTSNDLGPVGDDEDYVWGDQIDLKDIIAGDILQFRDHVVKTTTEAEYTFADGTDVDDTKEVTAERGSIRLFVFGSIFGFAVSHYRELF
jgi:hypothetical protein